MMFGYPPPTYEEPKPTRTWDEDRERLARAEELLKEARLLLVDEGDYYEFVEDIKAFVDEVPS